MRPQTQISLLHASGRENKGARICASEPNARALLIARSLWTLKETCSINSQLEGHIQVPAGCLGQVIKARALEDACPEPRPDEQDGAGPRP